MCALCCVCACVSHMCVISVLHAFVCIHMHADDLNVSSVLSSVCVCVRVRLCVLQITHVPCSCALGEHESAECLQPLETNKHAITLCIAHVSMGVPHVPSLFTAPVPTRL